jgi:hypothetical protein
MQNGDDQFQPGAVISPQTQTPDGEAPPADATATAQAEIPQVAPAQAVPQPQAAPVQAAAPLPSYVPETQAPAPDQSYYQQPPQPGFQPNGGVYTGGSMSPQAGQGLTEEEGVLRWAATEYVAQQKNGGWFFMLMVGAVVAGGVLWFVTHSIITPIAVLGVALAVGIAGARQPKTQEYGIGPAGLQIGQKFFPYEYFKSFALVEDNGVGYVSLLPLKRLAPPMALYYASSDEDRIVDMLAEFLPIEEHANDLVDRLARKVRF